MNIYKVILTAWQHDKKNESNRQMLIRVGINFLLLFFIILIFDSLLDWFLAGIHFIFGLIHLFTESIEYIVGAILEHSLETNSKQSDIIIANSTIFIALYLLYHFYRAAPRLCVRLKKMLSTLYARWVRKETAYWQALPLSQKIYWIISHISGFSGLLLLMTL
ncbi:MAG: hypothetical protein Q9M50_01480 [Methylococcales bacterium]|nr:hypothetical protein [Methylococcales bacterium]